MPTARSSPKIEKPAYERGKHLAIQIFLESLAAVDVRHAMLAKLKFQGQTLTAGDVLQWLPRPPRVIALGKAAAGMTSALSEILAGRVEAGIVASPSGSDHPIEPFRYFAAGHPYPNSGSFAAAQAALDLLSGLTADDTVIFLLSGGGSALFEKPLDPEVTLDDIVKFNRAVVTSHLPIEEINVLRKHLSAVKGGRLAIKAYPASQLTIYISDVPEGMASTVASGPTLPDESTVEDCYWLLEKRGILPNFPPRIRRLFEERLIEETPKQGDERLRNSRYFCLLSNRDAVEAARQSAERYGFAAGIDASNWDADFRNVVQQNLESLDALAGQNPERPVCLVAGGEVICPAAGDGIGGRNQAFVLYAAQQIEGRRRVVLSAGTDGRDGNSPATGAIADGQTISRARALNLDAAHYLAESDSYHFFRTLGDTLDTGFTDNNVRDVRLWLDFGEAGAIVPRGG